ncbi:MAG: flippase [Cyanobacteria bacterium P01_G01_bin.39]
MVNNAIANFKNRLFQQIVGSFGLRVTYMGCTFLTNIILARFLGANDFGIYTYTVSWAYLLGVFGTVGLDNLLVREVAIYHGQAAWGLLRGILRWANQISLLVSLGLSFIAVAIAFFTGMAQDPPLFLAFCIAMAALPFTSLRNLRRGAMRGLQEVSWGLIPEMLIAPVAIILSIVIAFLIWQDQLTAAWCVLVYTLVTVLTLIISQVLLKQFLPTQVSSVSPQYQVSKWFASALPFMLLEGIYVINARVDILMLGSLSSITEAGIYVPVNRGAQLINFVLMAISSALAPTIARLYSEGKLNKLEATIVKTARLALLPTCVFTVILIAISPWYLSLFGTEFIQGKNALVILSLGQLIFTVTGLGGLLLNMTGNERYTAVTGGFSAILNTLLNYILIFHWGVMGAAIATSISLLVMNFSNIYLVHKKLNIKCTAIGL